GYGRKGCVIFRPKNVSYKAGDVFDVHITGADTDIDYTVTFFDINNVQTVPEETVKGDIDGNGAVSTSDLILIKKYLTGDRSVSASAADLNSDGAVDAQDFLTLKAVLMK
ncbi:MAG: dockerin type I repeat-containing protein, partial [Oscillospiraceae bacterium]|nr:dockerin type I repeat-containing protein [Oscillospiraceae bacterium]